jgi:hypothetical protein
MILKFLGITPCNKFNLSNSISTQPGFDDFPSSLIKNTKISMQKGLE